MLKFTHELTLTYRGMVYPWECDHMGLMNIMSYTGKFDEASWQLLARLGMTRSYMIEEDTLMPVVKQDTSYKRELRAGDILTIRSGVTEIREKTIRFFHEMRNDETGEIAAISALTCVYLDAQTRRSRRFPDDFIRRVAQHVADRDPFYPDEIHDTLPQGKFVTDPRFPVSSTSIHQTVSD